MSEIFLSYRRDDSAYPCGWMYDKLAAQFGRRHIFIDVDKMPAGSNFREHAAHIVRQSDVQLVIIGPKWLTIANPQGPRLFVPDDPVRIEIEEALRQETSIIPILVDGAPMPRADQLPASLAPIAALSALPVRPNPDFSSDVKRVIKAIKEVTPARVSPTFDWRSWESAAALGGFVAIPITLIGVISILINMRLFLFFSSHFSLLSDTRAVDADLDRAGMQIPFSLLFWLGLIIMGICAGVLCFFIGHRSLRPRSSMVAGICTLIFLGTPFIAFLLYANFIALTYPFREFVFFSEYQAIDIDPRILPIFAVYAAGLLVASIALIVVVRNSTHPTLTLGTGLALLLLFAHRAIRDYVDLTSPDALVWQVVWTVALVTSLALVIVLSGITLIRSAQLSDKRWFYSISSATVAPLIVSLIGLLLFPIFSSGLGEIMFGPIVTPFLLCWPLTVFAFSLFGPPLRRAAPSQGA